MHALSRETPRRILARQIILDFLIVYLNAHYFCITEHVHIIYHNKKAICNILRPDFPRYTKPRFALLVHIYFINSLLQMLRLKGGSFGVVWYDLHFRVYHHFFLFLFKDSELNELRKTIELLKKQNAAAQAAINGVINTPELNCKGEKQTPHIATVGCPWDFSLLGNSWCNRQGWALSLGCALGACFGIMGIWNRICVNSAICSIEVNGCVGYVRRHFNKAFPPSVWTH